MTDETLVIKYLHLKNLKEHFETRQYYEDELTSLEIRAYTFLASVCKYRPITFEVCCGDLKIVICHPEGSEFTKQVKQILNDNGIEYEIDF